jgi:serine phosphatase RsbU (regulator of sigma subunit)
MATVSLTGSESFQLRLRKSEAGRALLMCAVFTVMILLTLSRRIAGGVVMSNNHVFVPYMAVLIAALAYNAWLARRLRRPAIASGHSARVGLIASAVIDLLAPALLLIVLNLWSPRGPYAALSAPALLLLPITILMSVLRLKPRVTLWMGLAAAVFHGGLALKVFIGEELKLDQLPVLGSYAALLGLTGVAGMWVASSARRYVSEAVAEAEARERAGLRLAAVERDLEVAREIQRGLLPAGSPSFAGFDIAGMNIPAEQTGGDYYDWQLLPNGRLLVVMADVTGHGIGPALVMAVCRAYARASAPLDSDPPSLVARLNELLCPDLAGARFITFAIATLDQTGAVELVSAGHGPTLWYNARDGVVEQFGGDGLPLAVMEGEAYGPSRRFMMGPEDVLVMLTDGSFEWQNPQSEQFGTKRLEDTLAQCAGLPAAKIVDRLHKAVLEHARGVPQADDLTIVAIKRTAGG